MHGSRFSPDGMSDVGSGLVDDRIMALIEQLSRDHELFVTLIKTGHPMGPVSPAGVENSHHFYRAIDIGEVDGAAVVDRPIADPVLALGRTLMHLTDGRPDSVMGPAQWLAALGRGNRIGFRDDEHAVRRHTDHLHLGSHP